MILTSGGICASRGDGQEDFMRLLFKQRMFSWFDSYDIYNEAGETMFTVKGRLAWGHMLEVYDRSGRHVGTLKERVFRFLPTFEMYVHDRLVGTIQKEFTFFRPAFHLDCNGWRIDGNWAEWDYTISDHLGLSVATLTKQIFNWTDTYIMDIANDSDALTVLMVVLAIDAEKCSRN